MNESTLRQNRRHAADLRGPSRAASLIAVALIAVVTVLTVAHSAGHAAERFSLARRLFTRRAARSAPTLPAVEENAVEQDRAGDGILSGERRLSGEVNTAPLDAEPSSGPFYCPVGCDVPPRAQDDLWIVDTRGVGCDAFGSGTAPAVRFQRYDHVAGWRQSSLAELLAADDRRNVTTFYIHGNRLTPADALSRGWTVYHALLHDAGAAPPLRYVIWSWPSERVRGQKRDVRYKAQRSDTESLLLAWLLGRLDPSKPVSMTGFSLGARIITGAMHVLDGGSLSTGTLPPEAMPREKPPGERQVRAVLLAAAIHDYWLEPGEYHGRALGQMESTLLLYNSCDRALRYYPHLWRCENPMALGYVGVLRPDALGQYGDRIRQADVCCTIGRAHRPNRWICSPDVMGQIRPYALWQPVNGGQ